MQRQRVDNGLSTAHANGLLLPGSRTALFTLLESEVQAAVDKTSSPGRPAGGRVSTLQGHPGQGLIHSPSAWTRVLVTADADSMDDTCGYLKCIMYTPTRVSSSLVKHPGSDVALAGGPLLKGAAAPLDEPLQTALLSRHCWGAQDRSGSTGAASFLHLIVPLLETVHTGLQGQSSSLFLVVLADASGPSRLAQNLKITHS
ncbi:hypothetical protein H920_16383 [Fukomys damarensis]|uniref:Uncharacterized protein n=1 Tax=Fukomys damarensis TaxID=885580 RepID=A0A091CSD0_FUKDA|nr:hypothetical protein H920_16383 [Fukomys damarensis]